MEPSHSFKGYNPNSQSVRRILREYREMQSETSTLFKAAPLEDNIFEWHFTIRGPRDTEFEGGVYHGRILLPAEYPYKPPDIVFLTPNGRFELDKKICLTISSHHEETWRPSWSIRTVLVALIAFMPTKGDGALASLDWPPEERKKLAKRSLGFKCDKCGVDCLTALPPEDEKETASLADVPDELQIRDASASRTATPQKSTLTQSSPGVLITSPSTPDSAAGVFENTRRQPIASSVSVPPQPDFSSAAPASSSSSSSSSSTTSSYQPSPYSPSSSSSSSSTMMASSPVIAAAPEHEQHQHHFTDKTSTFVFECFMWAFISIVFAMVMRKVAVGFPGWNP